MPIAQSPLESLDGSPAQNVSPAAVSSQGKFQVKNAAGETRISLSDLMRQLRFESGEATITSEGYQVLHELIAHLKADANDRLIRVEGHADNMEIGPSLKSRYQTNWDLSKARAVRVLRYIIEKGGIDSEKLSSVGQGDTKPITSNATEAGRQKNRRVDIVLYSPEPAGAQPEQAKLPIETSDSAYTMSRRSSTESGASTSRVDQTVPATATDLSKKEQPLSVPAEPAAPTTPAPGGQSNSDHTAPVAPAQ
jgi:chemotaxis protein MotB